MRRTTSPLLFALALALLPLSPLTAEAEDGPIDFQQVIATAKRRVYPALVFVKPVQEDLSDGEKRRVEVLGSGVIFREDGYVVTNHHVAEKAKEIRCVLGDRRQIPATIVGTDKLTDLAVLKLELPKGEKLPYAPFGKSEELEEGQFVMALGSPYGFERSISLGIVSNARRVLDAESHPYNTWIQTDAAINPGNSGGPLVNTRGEVIGINTLGFRSANNLGFAVPVHIVKRVTQRLLDAGRIERARHGITLRPLVDYSQNTIFEGDDGVIVDDVAAASPAKEGGLEKGDRILAIGGKNVVGKYPQDLPAIRWMLADLPPDKSIPLRVRRGKEELNLSLVPAKDTLGDDKGLECDRWDVTFQRITPEEQPTLHFYQPGGVFVLGVSYPGNAASSGLRPRDVVIKVDKQTVDSLDRLEKIYDAVMASDRPKKKVLFEVLRSGYRKFIALDYERDYDRKK